ncbi:MAG: nuclear transport factor 2 family protein [Planctomycetota bacterium]
MKCLPKPSVAVICLAPLALAVCSQQPQTPRQPLSPQQIGAEAPNAEADVEAIKQWVARYCATVIAGDFDGYRAFWTDDVVWLPPHAPVQQGIEACMDHNRPFFEQYDLVETMSVEEIEVADRFAFVRVNYTFKATPKADAEPVEEDGKGVFLLRRRPDGSWVSSHCVWNFNTPLAE